MLDHCVLHVLTEQCLGLHWMVLLNDIFKVYCNNSAAHIKKPKQNKAKHNIKKHSKNPQNTVKPICIILNISGFFQNGGSLAGFGEWQYTFIEIQRAGKTSGVQLN